MMTSELMTKNVFVCNATDSLSTAAGLMWNHDCGCIPVVDSENRPIAMLTDRDVCMAAYTQGLPLLEMTVSSAASKELHRVLVSDTIETAEALMQRKQVRRLPVVDAAGKLVGLISLNDIARQATRSAVGKSSGLSSTGVAQTLAAICEVRAQHTRTAVA